MKFHEIPYKVGDEVVVTTKEMGVIPGIYVIQRIVEDNIAYGEEFPIDIKELPILLRLDQVREVTKLDKALK